MKWDQFIPCIAHVYILMMAPESQLINSVTETHVLNSRNEEQKSIAAQLPISSELIWQIRNVCQNLINVTPAIVKHFQIPVTKQPQSVRWALSQDWSIS